MADTKKVLVFNGVLISKEDALEKLKVIYGEKSRAEILTGIESGKYSHASVVGGHLAFVPAESAKPAKAPAAPAAAPENPQPS